MAVREPKARINPFQNRQLVFFLCVLVALLWILWQAGAALTPNETYRSSTGLPCGVCS